MSLPAGQRRAPNRIEKTLADDDPRLGLLFAAFTRLAGQEAMPVTEPVTGRPRRQRMWTRRFGPRSAPRPSRLLSCYLSRRTRTVPRMTSPASPVSGWL